MKLGKKISVSLVCVALFLSMTCVTAMAVDKEGEHVVNSTISPRVVMVLEDVSVLRVYSTASSIPSSIFYSEYQAGVKFSGTLYYSHHHYDAKVGWMAWFKGDLFGNS